MLKWFKRVALLLIAILGVMLLSGFAYEQWSRWTAAREYPPPGQLVDVNGHKLHLNCSGVGGPTVILEHGIIAYGSVWWAIVQPEIAKTNRVCSYDRSGYMWSDRRRPAPTGMENVADLHLALEIAGESPPYILVGHSYGGIVMRIFAARYPTEVDGLVFVDSSHPDQQERSGEEVLITPWWVPAYYWTLDHSGFTRIWQTESADKVPSEAVFALEFSPQTMPGSDDEISEKSRTYQQARETGPFGDIPIIVLTARLNMGPSEEQSAELAAEEIEDWQKSGELWYQLHSELAALSTVNDHRIVEGSEHRIPFQAPESIVQAVRDAVAMSVRAGDGTEN